MKESPVQALLAELQNNRVFLSNTTKKKYLDMERELIIKLWDESKSDKTLSGKKYYSENYGGDQ